VILPVARAPRKRSRTMTIRWSHCSTTSFVRHLESDKSRFGNTARVTDRGRGYNSQPLQSRSVQPCLDQARSDQAPLSHVAACAIIDPRLRPHRGIFFTLRGRESRKSGPALHLLASTTSPHGAVERDRSPPPPAVLSCDRACMEKGSVKSGRRNPRKTATCTSSKTHVEKVPLFH
jgi:hypothetical protein